MKNGYGVEVFFFSKGKTVTENPLKMKYTVQVHYFMYLKSSIISYNFKSTMLVKYPQMTNYFVHLKVPINATIYNKIPSVNR